MEKSLDSRCYQPPPDELYHYTSQEGLIGILKTSTIWASKITHLNDAAELFLALDLARKEIQSLNVNSDLKDGLLDDIDSMEAGSINVFVFSLTENGDQLSQWRGYTPVGSGYSIGLSANGLTVAANKFGKFTLGPCCYDPHIQRKVVSELVSQALERRRNLGQEVPRGDKMSSNSLPHLLPFRQALYFAAPFLKHEAFSEEREWRLVSTPISHSDPSFSHRPGISHLVPYFALPLREGQDLLPVRRIIVGPTPNPDLACAAVLTLAASLDIGGLAIETSEIPFRPW